MAYLNSNVFPVRSEKSKKLSIADCGYKVGVKVPPEYSLGDKDYPVIVFLHGRKDGQAGQDHWLSRSFNFSMEDPYILVIPAKREWDWNPQKVFDVLEDLKANMRVDTDRIYLTGLSMGGRGTYIVGAELPHYFAALMPLSPHHEPYSYLPLASKIAHLPIWMSHGTADEVSSYEMASEMAKGLEKKGAYISFHPIEGGIHWGWKKIYSSPARINWLLSQKRGTPPNYELRVINGTGSGCYEAGQIIDISAANEDDGTNLGRWSSTGEGLFEGRKAKATKFTMPSQDVEVSFNLRSRQQDKK